MTLLDAFLSIVGPWRAVFPQQRSYRRAVRQSLGSLVCLGRRCLSRVIWTTGGGQRSWSGEYFLHSRCQWQPQQLFAPILKRALPYCRGRLVGVALDDTRLRKTGRSIPQAFYQRDPMSPPFHVNLTLGLRFLQASLLLPLHRGGEQSARALPIRFEEVSRVKRPGKKATAEMKRVYKEAQKRLNLSQRFVEAGLELRCALDAAGALDKTLVLAGDGSFCNKTCWSEIPERSVLLLRARKDASLCFPANDGSRRVYAVEKFTPEQVRQDERQAWKTTKIFYGGKRRKLRYKQVRGVLVAGRRATSAAAVDRCRADALSQSQEQTTLLSSAGPTADERSQQLAQTAVADLLRPLADRGKPPRREGHLGGGPGAVMERGRRTEATSLGGGGLQRFAAGFADRLRPRARRGLCRTAQMASQRQAPFVPGPDHPAPRRNRPTTSLTRRISDKP